MRKIRNIFFLLFILFTTVAFAQKGEEYSVDERGSWQERVYFGGGFGLSSGTNGSSVNVSPLVGYMITSKLSAGVGATYQYYKFGDFSDNRYGGEVFARMNTFKQIFLYSSYQFINYNTNIFSDGSRRTIARLPLGAGMSQPVGSRASLNFLAAYDVLWDPAQQAYDSPWIFSVFFSL